MDVLTKDEFNVRLEDLIMNIDDGEIFIHPTDTIYGIGCDATSKEAVRKVRDVKNRNDKPFSVIAPGKKWILDNCQLSDKGKEWIEKLPGPYTLILKLKNKGAIAANVNFDMDTIGVRIPDHWFSEAVEKIGKPIISTSANKIGDNFMTNLEDLHDDIMNNVAFIIYEDPLN
jgi:L-threonylcarbamoyladenylate synthase